MVGLGKNLRMARVDANVSVQEAAEKTGYSVRTIQRWETDRFEPNADGFNALAEAYGCTLDKLITGRERARAA